MRSIIVILLSILVLIQSAGIGVADVFLCGRFVKHVEYHSENYGDDFFTFFEKHYGVLKAEHQKMHNEEMPGHQRMPFQHTAMNHLLSEMIVFSYDISIYKVGDFPPSLSNFHYQNLYSSLEKSSIFQPPKFI